MSIKMATTRVRDVFSKVSGGLENENDPIKKLYPLVNEKETPLPREWSVSAKLNSLWLLCGNLRVQYQGDGRSHKDAAAASVRATHPIPVPCGLYYFEVKIVSKGREGLMGIGLSAQGVSLSRLPGWEKNSYGYHGDDGHSFSSSAEGQSYGPTFTTGDVIGCGLNLIDNVCFYTKNGHYLGVAFTNLAPNLYPTVGLQTPGEVVDANFGQEPFVFDIGEVFKELTCRIHSNIHNYVIPDTHGQWQNILQRMVSAYLVHHGYWATAEAFAKTTNQDIDEEIVSIKNRQKIQKLVLSGRMGEAIKTVKDLYPGLLEHNQNLLFMLKVRQFIEMINGTDSEVHGTLQSPSSAPFTYGSKSPSPCSVWKSTKDIESSPVIQHTSVIQSVKRISSNQQTESPNISPINLPSTEELNLRNAQETSLATATNGVTTIIEPPPPSTVPSLMDSDSEMDCCDLSSENNHHTRNGEANGLNISNGFSKHADGMDDDMELENEENRLATKVCGGSPAAIERLINFGRELNFMSQRLKKEFGKNMENKKMLRNAFSLMAYNDPWNSTVGWQLNPTEREPVYLALNSAILESQQLPRRPSLEICIAHTKQLINLMSVSNIGSCAFSSVESVLACQQLTQVSQLSSANTSSQQLSRIQPQSRLLQQ